jgi:pyruvate kinase
MRKTRIICTLGPATESPEMLRKMLAAGADVFRLNMSHAQHDWCREIVPRIRQASDEVISKGRQSGPVMWKKRSN